MAEMVPENVVGPGAPVTRGPHVFEPRDEELTGQVAQMLVAPGDLLEQGLAFAPEAHRMAEGEHRAGGLGGGDHPLGIGEPHGERDLDERRLALRQAGERVGDVQLGGAGDDHRVDRRVGE